MHKISLQASTYICAGKLDKQFSPRSGVAVQVLCLSNHGCVCTSKLSVVGTVAWCWGRQRWNGHIHTTGLPSPPCPTHKPPVERGPGPCQLLACAWELFGKVGPGSAVPGTVLTIKQHRQLPSSAWERSSALFHLPRWTLALEFKLWQIQLGFPLTLKGGKQTNKQKKGIQGSSSAACGPS